MAQPTPVPITEKTFTSYNHQQGSTYASVRRSYHPSVYQAILTQHTTTGGQLNALLDIGCGPGLAIRDLSPHFTTAIGLDPSPGMISAARSHAHAPTTNTPPPNPIRYYVSTASQLGSNLTPPIPPSSIDLITAANAAHWFHMPTFWARAASLLHPSGTIALWTTGPMRAHPAMPNAPAIQEALDRYQERDLDPYYEPGNRLARNRYKGLPLPWHVQPPVAAFDEARFVRRDWELGERFVAGEEEVGLDGLERLMASASAHVRWAEAHPQLVGTEGDCLRVLRRAIERLLQEAGVEPGKEMVRGTVQGTLLIIKKKL